MNGGYIDGNIIGAHFVSDFTVDSLKVSNSKSWNGDLVQHVFSENITTSIPNMSFFNQVPNDRLVWKDDKNGLYYV